MMTLNTEALSFPWCAISESAGVDNPVYSDVIPISMPPVKCSKYVNVHLDSFGSLEPPKEQHHALNNHNIFLVSSLEAAHTNAMAWRRTVTVMYAEDIHH